MGEFKLLLPWVDQRPVVRHVVNRLCTMPLEPLVVVTGFRADHVREALSATCAVFAHNSDYADGEMMSSLKVGLCALPDQVNAVMVVPGDLPMLSSETIRSVIAAYQPDQIIVPMYEKQRGHPVIFPRMFWPALLDLKAGQAPRDVLRAHASAVRQIPVDDEGILIDVDTQEDYQRALRRAQNTES
jgi:molybdenum cofactor cytidylyltransferase